MGQAAPEAHLRDELGLAEGTHVCGQHCWAAQQGPWASRVVGSNLRVDHLLDLREEGRAFSVRKAPSSPPITCALQGPGVGMSVKSGKVTTAPSF